MWIEGIGIEWGPRETLFYTTRIWGGDADFIDTRSAKNADAQEDCKLREKKTEKKLLYTYRSANEAPAMRAGVRLGALRPYLTLPYLNVGLRKLAGKCVNLELVSTRLI